MRVVSRLSPRFILGLLVLAFGSLSLESFHSSAQRGAIAPDVQAALDRISAGSLRGHLSFIASDLLEGRNTPSRGLEIAAEYIAAQFRRAGLELVGDDGYFQTADFLLAERNAADFEMTFSAGRETIKVAASQISFTGEQSFDLRRAAVFKIDYQNQAATAARTPAERRNLSLAQVAGKVVLTELPDLRRADRSRLAELSRARNEFLSQMAALKAAAVISVDRANTTGAGFGSGRLMDPENRPAPRGPQGTSPITVHDPRVAALYDKLKPGRSLATLSLRLPAPVERAVKLRNVAGLLRGSDLTLKDTYVLVTAHYDHIGMRPGGEGDRIFNGANDDGSGTVSVIELAAALSTLKERPRRSIVFMTLFGEERGLLGSRYYGRHPLFPITKTVADINLEHLGRTDDNEGPQLASASLTGFDYTDLGQVFQTAGEMVGVRVFKHERNSDSFFGRSDNQALADQGVPAHTLCVAYLFPDYHQVGDHWEKIDYDNLAQVNRLVALGLLMIANNPEEPKWNEANPRTARYVKAWKERRGK